MKHKLIYVWLFALIAPLLCGAALPPAIDGQALPSLAPMLEKTTPAVVNISTSTIIREREHPIFRDPFFRHFFNIPQHREEKRRDQSLGSGVIIDARRGYVITNHHVIDKADAITVTLQDGRELEAKQIGSDPETDVALLEIPPKNLTEIKIADSDTLRVGDFVVAIGNPFGLGQTVTSGIVSALGRSGLGIEGYEDFIQTDASINPGNSGGALVNLNGELIGINTAILAPSGGNVGIGFAIPSKMANRIVEHLVEFGEVRRGVLGVQVQDLTPKLASAFSLDRQKGAVVVHVDPNSAAERAGVEVGDVIISINGDKVDNSVDMRNRIGLLRVGQAVKLEVIRQGRQKTLKGAIGEQDNLNGAALSPYLKGADFAEVLVETMRGPIQRVQVKHLQDGSPAAQLGLQEGDVLLSINRVRVQTLADLQELINLGGSMRIRLLRGETIVTLVLR
jgi:serine protease Do/serine protease DegQ